MRVKAIKAKTRKGIKKGLEDLNITG